MREDRRLLQGFIAVAVLIGLDYFFQHQLLGMLAEVALAFGCLLVASAVFTGEVAKLFPNANLDGLGAIVFIVLWLGAVIFEPHLVQWQLIAIAIMGGVTFAFFFVMGPQRDEPATKSETTTDPKQKV